VFASHSPSPGQAGETEVPAGDIFGSYEYYEERLEHATHTVVRRRPSSAAGVGAGVGAGAGEAGHVVVDVNKLSERLPQPVSLVYLRPSLSERYVAFLLQSGPQGGRRLFVKDMALSALCEVSFGDTPPVGNIHKFEWGCPAPAPAQAETDPQATQGEELYLLFDSDHVRPDLVYRYTLDLERMFKKNRFRSINVPRRRLLLLYGERDPACFVDVYRTKDDRCMLLLLLLPLLLVLVLLLLLLLLVLVLLLLLLLLVLVLLLLLLLLVLVLLLLLLLLVLLLLLLLLVPVLLLLLLLLVLVLLLLLLHIAPTYISYNLC
jgi:hypothetical protein